MSGLSDAQQQLVGAANRRLRECLSGSPVPLGALCAMDVQQRKALELGRYLYDLLIPTTRQPARETGCQVLLPAGGGGRRPVLVFNQDVRGELVGSVAHGKLEVRWVLPAAERAAWGHITVIRGADDRAVLYDRIPEVIASAADPTNTAAQRRLQGLVERPLARQRGALRLDQARGHFGPEYVSSLAASTLEAYARIDNPERLSSAAFEALEREIGVGLHSPRSVTRMAPLVESLADAGVDGDEAVVKRLDVRQAISVLSGAEHKAVSHWLVAAKEGVDFKAYCARNGLSYEAEQKAFERACRRISNDLRD
jgi:hypothetical protein